jgi:hypothetical protein
MSGNKVFRATGAVAMASSLTVTDNYLLTSVKLTLSAAGGAAENFTVTVNSATLAAYDTIIFSQDMNVVTDLLWVPDQPVPVLNGDVLDFAYTNTNTRTYGLEVTYRRDG